MEHTLKCWSPYFQAIMDGSKPFELRRADREFAVGDALVLHETDPVTDEPSGRTQRVIVTYVLKRPPDGRFADLLQEGACVLGIRFA